VTERSAGIARYVGLLKVFLSFFRANKQQGLYLKTEVLFYNDNCGGSNVNHTLRHKCNIQIMVKFTGFSVFFAVFGELVVRQP